MARRKKPKFEEASSALEALASTPRVKQKSALEIVVERDFDKLLQAIAVHQYSLSEISATLGKHGISSTPKLLKSALYTFAVEHNRVGELPEKLIPEGNQTDDSQPFQAQATVDEPSAFSEAKSEPVNPAGDTANIAPLPRSSRKIETAY